VVVVAKRGEVWSALPNERKYARGSKAACAVGSGLVFTST
jgi:hypothetical protein